ncbi:hypothetical protein GW918_00340 [Candidatus Berkelbacteria bacterium]|nr:hypothetical protein [Candidatus Berkelbacteria bacterium]
MNKFIVIEGIDGAGTTTQSILLAKRIFENRKDVKYCLLVSRPAENTV